METIKSALNGTLCAIGLWGHSTCIVTVQFLSLFVWPFSKKLYYTFHAHMMRQWSQNLFEIMNLFAPGQLIITLDESCTRENNDITDEGDNEEEEEIKLEHLLTRNKKGQVTGISFPERLIMISNHQVIFFLVRFLWFDMSSYSTYIDLCRLDLHLVFGLFIKSTWCNEDYVET